METKDLFLRGEKGKGTGGVPRDAATVVLLRGGTGGSWEVFLMRRHRNQSFMGGAHVFPGGSLDAADADPLLAAHIDGVTAAEARRLLQEPALPDAAALGFFIAAIRETFEEAGVLLARDDSGRPLDLTDPEKAARFDSYRLEIHGHRLSLLELARREHLRYAPDLLIPYSRWITPEIESRRFDTRFFLALLPEGQAPVHDRIELTESRWMTADFALEEHAAGRIVLMPPTLKTVEEVRAFSGREDLFAVVGAQRIQPLLPEPFLTENGYGVLLPHDPQYTLAAGKQPPRPGEASRIVMEGGLWKTRAG